MSPNKLTLVYEISVPSKLTTPIRDTPASVLLSEVSSAFLPDERDASAETGNLCGLRVNLNLAVAEVDAEFALVLRGEVLITEDYNVSAGPNGSLLNLLMGGCLLTYDGSLGYEKRQLILLFVVQVFELQAYDLRLIVSKSSSLP